jgi:hypothetical protein
VTVAEMIAALVKYDPSTPVCVGVNARWDSVVTFPVAECEDVEHQPCIRIRADVPTP